MIEETLVEQALHLPRREARRWAHTPLEQEDLVADGNLALAKAAKRYDPSYGVPFPAFATPYVRGAIADTVEQGLRGYDLVLQPGIGTLLPAAIELIAVSVVLLHFGHPEYLLVLAGAVLAYGCVVSRRSLSIQPPAEAVIAISTGADAPSSLSGFGCPQATCWRASRSGSA